MTAQNPVLRARQDGYNAALEDIRKAILDHLEAEYMSPKVARDSVEGKALLAVASDLAELLKGYQKR